MSTSIMRAVYTGPAPFSFGAHAGPRAGGPTAISAAGDLAADYTARPPPPMGNNTSCPARSPAPERFTPHGVLGPRQAAAATAAKAQIRMALERLKWKLQSMPATVAAAAAQNIVQLWALVEYIDTVEGHRSTLPARNLILAQLLGVVMPLPWSARNYMSLEWDTLNDGMHKFDYAFASHRPYGYDY